MMHTNSCGRMLIGYSLLLPEAATEIRHAESSR